jgi:hypothetical protein
LIKRSLSYNLVVNALRVALVAVIFVAGWSIYRRLPTGSSTSQPNGAGTTTTLQIVLQPSADDASGGLSIPVELYPIDVAAARREFFDPDNSRSERRTGMRFDDFLKRRMRGRQPVEARLDQKGQATVTVTPGKWWIHATLNGSYSIEWRLPISIYGRKQTIELTSDNAYARTKSF